MRICLQLLVWSLFTGLAWPNSAVASHYTEEEAQEVAEACIQSGTCGKSSKLRHAARSKLVSSTVMLRVARGEIVANNQNIDGLLSNLGARVSGDEIRIILESGVLFTFDKFELRPDAILVLNEVLPILKFDDFRNEEIRIEGHTDSIGSAEYNNALSRQRADAVVNWFVSNGISGSRMTSSGQGEHQPIDTNETEEGRQKNRRVEIKISRSGKT